MKERPMNHSFFAKLKIRFNRKRVMFIFLMAFLLGSNVRWMEETHAEENPSLVILPFMIEKGEDPGRGAICPLCKGVYRSGEILSGSQNTLTRVLYQKMEGMGRFKILPLEKVEGAHSFQNTKVFKEQPIPLSLQVGKELGANFLFIGFIFRFEERIGSSIGVERPASVSFDVHLFRLRDGMEVWKGKLDETQRPLSENLLKIGSFVRRKAHWLTAEELASVGMGEVLKKLPGINELEEIK
jgi:hypothetical protein